jgi:tetratricopeptide (TPR) repeat protein
MALIGRNVSCPCGSGKKYKHCCGKAEDKPPPLPVPELFLRAQQAQGEGRAWEAGMLYEAILARDPNHADATHYLGMVALQAGDLAKAQTLVAKSLQLNPRDGFYWMNQGLLYQRRKDTEKAVDAYQKAVELMTDNAGLWFNLGNGLMELRRLDEAISAFRRSLTLHAGDWQVWMNQGTTYLLRHRDEADSREALTCFEKMIKLAPGRGEGYNGKGLALFNLDRLAEAVRMVQEAVRVDPKLVNAWFNLARLHLELLDVDSALAAYQQATRLSPDTSEFYGAIGDTLSMVGKFDKAQEFFTKAYALNPGDLGALVQLLDNRPTPELLTKAEESVDTAADDAEGTVAALFTLGRIYDKRDQYDKAFGYYQRGNRIKKKEEVFDRAAHRQTIDQSIETFSADRIAELKRWGNASDRPVLILGMPRSGTTLTEQIVSAHSRVIGGGERMFWAEAWAKIEKAVWLLNKTGMAQIAQAYLDDLATIKGAESSLRVTDKMPGNFLRIGLIHSVFPNARIIHCRRNPVDVCLSIYFQNFAGSHPYAYDLDDLAFYHQEYQRLMAHWRQVIPKDRLFEFDYEEMVADQEGMSRQLLAFIGLEWEDACLDFHTNERAVKTASIRQVREKIYTRSVERWRNYEPYIGPLLKLLPAG